MQVARLQAEGMLSKVQAELVRLRDFDQMRREREDQYRQRFEQEQVKPSYFCHSSSMIYPNPKELGLGYGPTDHAPRWSRLVTGIQG